MMTLINDLISDLPDTKVRDVHVGYTWIGVLSRNCGVAKNLGAPHNTMVRDIGRLTEKTTLELAGYLRSWNMIEAGLGLAAVNSLISPRGKNLNVNDFLLENGIGKKIAMIGHFPIVDELRKCADELWVIEKEPQKGDLPDTASEHFIPKADIVVITSSAIINKSIERLLELSKGYTVVLGPSTPMSDILFDYGVDMIAGIKVVDEEMMMAKITEGGGKVKQFEDAIKFLVMEK
ncbi:MAG: Rossmann-like domain-containing protein [Methanosarcinaceae archaeon]